MGFFYAETKTQQKGRSNSKHIPIESLNKMGCKVCPLDKEQPKYPKLEPVGSENPLIYILGEAPGEKEKEPFYKEGGDLVKAQFTSKQIRNDLRFNNVIRCNSTEEPTQAILECCRNFAVEDIERTKPLVVVGAGNLALTWATGITAGVTTWRGHLIATKIGNHPCWFLPVLNPDFVLRKRKKYGKSEYELVFEHDLKEMIRTIPEEPPKLYNAPYDDGIEIITGQEGATDLKRLESVLERLKHYSKVGIDLETSGLRPYGKDSRIYTVAIGTFEDTVAFPLDHPEGWSETNRKRAWELFITFLLFSGEKIAHNLAFETEWLAYFVGEQILRLTNWGDTLLQSHTLDETPGTHSLDSLTREHFGFFLKDQSRVDPARLLEFPIRETLRYNGMDAKWTALLEQVLQTKIQANRDYITEYERKVRLAPTLVLTQLKGVPVDIAYAKQMEKTLLDEIKSIERKLEQCSEIKQYTKRFGRFEPTNNEQVLVLMRDVCKREEIYVDNKQSTDEEVLSQIDLPSAKLILEHRAVSKLLSTYIAPILSGKIISYDGLIHTAYSSVRAVTGRLASSDPNLQNFPKRKRREIRGVVAVPRGWWLVAADYGQIEARVFAMASEDRRLVEYLWTGYDIHGFWADRFMQEYGRIKDRIIEEYSINGDDTKKIRKTFRDEIKNGWVFPQFFGSSVKSCSQNLKVPESIAEDLSREFWSDFPGVKKWQEKLLKKYERDLYVETLTGRRRRGVMTKNQILNHPIQGTALDIVTEGMNAVSELSQIEDNEELQPNINIHDDLTFIMQDFLLEEQVPRIAIEMCRHRFDFINVPLIVEVSVGARWHELKEIGVYRSNELFNLRAP